ncbi:PREDICTED: olfactory receptor 5D13-like [Galeopterus variegatus]|uniref:Olfactory receptor 5D13-like n=1 Tax=Galeopterus variegatus TaxID=482537 RepID=A0ABM0Q0N6_GALVR|nr:PREDICTED: olfactory receptor 5D13-like [Galeopterus variegatus]
MLLAEGNQSSEVTFILLGFSEYPDLQVPLFLTEPSFMGCIMQFFLASIFAVAETFMLAVMAYDRFVAVCNPLLYTVVMSPKLCVSLVSGPYAWGIDSSLTLTCFLLALSFCGSNIMNNFVCEHSVIVSVLCSDPYISQLLCFVITIFNEVSSLVIVPTTYSFIFDAVMKMPSAGGCHKDFSTCASHQSIITIFHGTILFLYCVPHSKNSWLTVKVGSVFYTVVIPMLNPLIYSLRNKDVEDTVRKLMNHPAKF